MTIRHDSKFLAERAKKFMIDPTEFASMQDSNLIRLVAMKEKKLFRWNSSRGILVKY
jgi:hypothetical protein